MTTIEQAAAECRNACKDLNVGDVAQHIHHERWLEILIEPIGNRITFILDNKDISERAERLRRLRPFDWKKADEDWKKAYEDWKKVDEDWKKAHEDLKKAYEDWKKVDEDRKKVDEDWKKAYEDWKKAHEDWKKADEDRKKAHASPQMVALHSNICGCPWDATHDIFGKDRR